MIACLVGIALAAVIAVVVVVAGVSRERDAATPSQARQRQARHDAERARSAA